MQKLVFDIGEEVKIGSGRSIVDLFRSPPWYGQAPGEPTLGYFISQILPNIYVLAGLILFALLIFGGLSIIMGAGQENPEKIQKGQKAAVSAIIGFLIIFGSYWLIQIIEAVTGIKIFKPGF